MKYLTESRQLLKEPSDQNLNCHSLDHILHIIMNFKLIKSEYGDVALYFSMTKMEAMATRIVKYYLNI